MRRMDDKGFAIVGSAVIVALAIFMGFGAAVIMQRSSMLHQAKLSGQRIARKSHEGLTVSVNRGSNSTGITITNDGSSTVVFDRLLLKQPDNRVVMMPSDNEFFDDLAGWWRFSEGSGDTAYDYSGNGNDGALHGNPKWVDGWIGDGALSFDGTDDHVDVPQVHLPPNSWSISWWMDPDDDWLTNAQNNRRQIFCRAMDQGNNHITIEEGGLWFESSTNNEWQWHPDVSQGMTKPHHYTFVFDSDGSYLYVDGQLEASTGASTDTNNWDLGNIGGYGHHTYYGDYFKGQIDDVRIYDRVFSPGEISKLSKCNVLLYPVSLTPLESYTVTYPFRVDNQAAVGVYTRLGNTFWEVS